jgi:GNAT superfamily N-acetyltransferase
MTVEITTDRARMDVAAIHRYLAGQSYWAANIPLPLLARALDHSLCFAAVEGAALVGFARVITDHATFAYLADVFVIASHRGRGIAKQIMEAIRLHPELQNLRRWHLVTRDAHGLYEQYGFRPLERPDRHMELTKTDAYR